MKSDPLEYKVTTAGYLARAESLRKDGGLTNLFYAAFEIRCALERTMVDFLVLTAHTIPPGELIRDGQYKPRVVLGLIRKEAPEFEKRLHFTRLVMLASGVVSTNVPFDFEWVCDSHDTLNGYLHHQKDPESTTENKEWISKFESNVDSIRCRLLEMWKSNRGFLKDHNGPGDQVWKLFRTGSYTDREIIRMLQMSDLPESMRS